MELTIEKLKKIDGPDLRPRTKKTSSPSDLNLHTLSITAPPVLVPADVAEDEYFSDYDEDGEKKKPVAELKPEALKDLETGEYVRIIDLVDRDWSLFGYTVNVDDHRILTLATTSNEVAARWLKEVLRCFRGKRGGDKIVVGVVVGVDESRRSNDFLQLCIGSQCLVYELPAFYDVDYEKCPLHEFFANRRVITAGVNMSAVAKKMSNERKIEFANVMDLNEFAVEALENGYELDLKKYDLDRLGKTVLGKRWYVERPEKPINWQRYYYYYWCERLGIEKVKHATYDAYTSYMIATKLLEMKSKKKSAASAGKKSNKKKGDKP